MDGYTSSIQTCPGERPGSTAAAPERGKFPLLTRRLCLRPPRLEDGRALSEILPDAPACLAGWRVPTSPDEAEAHIRDIDGEMRAGAGLGLLIVAQSSGGAVGWFELDRVRNQARDAKLGIWLSEDCRGQGFGVEAARAAIPVGMELLNLRMLRAEASSDNLAAIRMLRRLGLKPVGSSKAGSGTIGFRKDLTGIV